MSGEQRSPDESRYEFVEGGLADRLALEKVLGETLSDKSAEPLQDLELRALLSVANRNRNAAFLLEPVVSELVESILRIRFNRIDAPDEYWKTMSLAIATSLYETPAVRNRLTGFWNSLLEVTT